MCRAPTNHGWAAASKGHHSSASAAARAQILHDELEGLESSAQRAFDINALEGTVFDVSRSSLLIAVSRKHSETLEAVGPRGMWRCDKHIPQTTVERQIQVRSCCWHPCVWGGRLWRHSVIHQRKDCIAFVLCVHAGCHEGVRSEHIAVACKARHHSSPALH